MTKIHDLIIIGSGPAGYTAAIYAKRAGINPILIQGLQIGGQLTLTTEVENFPGFVSILGTDLMKNMQNQIQHLEVEQVFDVIKEVNFDSYPYELKGENDNYIVKSVIIATGSSAKYLQVKGEAEFTGFGVSACSTCDGFFFKNQTVAVVGGGNTALEDAIYLSNIAKKVYLIHRRETFRGEQIIQNKVKKIANIEFKLNCIVEEMLGTNNPKSLTGITIKNILDQNIQNLAIDGVFIAIGHTPNTSFLQGKVDLDADGYILTNNTAVLRDSKPLKGIYAAGDVQDKIYRQAVTSAGTGCIAALNIKNFLFNT